MDRKRILSFALAMAMCSMSAVPAFAEAADGTPDVGTDTVVTEQADEGDDVFAADSTDTASDTDAPADEDVPSNEGIDEAADEVAVNDDDASSEEAPSEDTDTSDDVKPEEEASTDDPAEEGTDTSVTDFFSVLSKISAIISVNKELFILKFIKPPIIVTVYLFLFSRQSAIAFAITGGAIFALLASEDTLTAKSPKSVFFGFSIIKEPLVYSVICPKVFFDITVLTPFSTSFKKKSFNIIILISYMPNYRINKTKIKFE